MMPGRAGHSGFACTLLVQANAAALFALHFLGVTLNSGSGFTLTLGGRLFVEFAATNFGQNTGFFAGALETTQSYVEGFVLFNFDGWHPGLPSLLPEVCVFLATARKDHRFLRVADVTASSSGMQSL